MKKSELYDLLHDLVGDFPAGVRSNALDAAREELEAHEAAQHRVKADGVDRPCINCGLPKSKHDGRAKFCPHHPTAYA